MPLCIAITGASGLVGRALSAALLARGDTVRRLVRRAPRGDDEVEWDPRGGALDEEVLRGVDAIVHLAGKNIGGARWTPTVKDEVMRSRVEGTRVLAEAIAASASPPVFVSASATGIFGDRGDTLLDETSAPGEGYLAEVCEAWEAAAEPARVTGVRVVNARLGVVLTHEGGALERMMVPFRLGAGGPLGSGRQYMPFITLVDVVRALIRLVDDDSLIGPVHVVAPTPATNAELTRALGAALGRPSFMKAPAFALRLAMGKQMADEMLLASQRVVPKKLLAAGFEFAHPTIDVAISAALEI